MNAYEREPYRVELDVEVVDRGEHAGRPFVVLDDTILYPEGGGQPADRGWLDDTAVIDVQRAGAQIRHFVAGEVAGGAALMRLDWRRRFDHMQQHTAQHLITAVAADELGWSTTSFHLGETVSDIELDVTSISAEQLTRLEASVAERIRRALPVTDRRVGSEEYARLEVRSRGLPEGHRGDIRLVEIAGVDCNTCGGTHVGNTAEIEAVALLGSEPMRGGTRLYWLAGGRVRHRLHLQEERLGALRRLFETSDDRLAEVAEGKIARLEAAERTIKGLRGDLARAAAETLSAGAGRLIEAHFAGADAAFLQRVGREILAAGDHRPAFLTAEGDSGAFFLLCAAPAAGIDLRAVADQVTRALQGRGGGTAEMLQGKAGSLEGRERAVEMLRHVTEEAG